MRPLLFVALVLMLAGLNQSCKHPTSVTPDSTKCDTCNKPCDTCNKPTIDTTSHNFTWMQFLNVGNENDMTGCWVFGPNYILANNAYMHMWNGSAWKTLNLYCTDPMIGRNINGSMSGCSIFAFDTSDYWLTDGITFHYMGGGIVESYRVTYTTSPHALHTAWGTSSSDMYFVGDSGTILHFDGTNWTKMNSGTTTDIHSIWGTGDNNIWACGTDDPNTTITVLLHYNGNSWSVDAETDMPTSQSGGFESVWTCDSTTTHQVAWTSGTTIYHKTDNGPWVRDTESLTLDLSGFFVTGSAPNNVFAAGTRGDIIHWNGLTWNQYNQYYSPGDPNYFPHQISMNGGTICIVGYKDGQSWILVGQQQ